MTSQNYIDDFRRRALPPNNLPNPELNDFRRRAQLQNDQIIPRLEDIGSKAFTLFANSTDPVLRSDWERNQSTPTFQSQQRLFPKLIKAENERQTRLDVLDEQIKNASKFSDVKSFGWESPERAEAEIYYQASKDPEMKAILQYEILYDVNEEFGNVYGEFYNNEAYKNFKQFEADKRRESVENQIGEAARSAANIYNPKLSNIPKAAFNVGSAITPQPVKNVIGSGYQAVPQSARNVIEGFGKSLATESADFGLLGASGVPMGEFASEQLEFDRPAGLLGSLGLTTLAGKTVAGILGFGSQKGAPVLGAISNQLTKRLKVPRSQAINNIKHKLFPRYTMRGKEIVDQHEIAKNIGTTLVAPIVKTGQVVKSAGQALSKPPQPFTRRDYAAQALDMPLGLSAQQALEEGGAPTILSVGAGIGTGLGLAGTLDTPTKWALKRGANTGQAVITSPVKLAKATKAKIGGIDVELKPVDVYAESPASPKNLNNLNPTTPVKQKGLLGNDQIEEQLKLEMTENLSETLKVENARRAKSGLKPLDKPTVYADEFKTGGQSRKEKILKEQIADGLHDDTYQIRRNETAFRTNFKKVNGRNPTADEFQRSSARLSHLNGSDNRTRLIVENMFEEVEKKLPQMKQGAQHQILDHYAKVLKAIDVITNSKTGYRKTDAGKLFAFYLGETEEKIIRDSKKSTGLYLRKLQGVLQQIEAGLGADDYNKLDDGLKIIRAKINENNQRMVKSGLMSQELFDLFKTKFPNYTPTRWVNETLDDSEQFITKAQTKSEKYNSGIGEEKLNNELAEELAKETTGLDLDASLKLTFSEVDKAISKNELNKSVIAMALDDATMTQVAQNSNKTLNQLREDQSGTFWLRRVLTDEEEKLLQTSKKDLGRFPRIASRGNELSKEILELEKKGIPIIFKKQGKFDNTIQIYEKGYKKTYEVNSVIAKEIKEQGVPLPIGISHPISSAVNASRQIFSSGVTQNPAFAGLQIGTDALTAVMRSGDEVNAMQIPFSLLNSFRKTLQKELGEAVPSIEKIPIAGKWNQRIKDTENILNDLYVLSGAGVARWGSIDDARKAIKGTSEQWSRIKINPKSKFLLELKESGGKILENKNQDEILDSLGIDMGNSIARKNQFLKEDTKELKETISKVLIKGLKGTGKTVGYGFNELPQYGEVVIRRMVFQKYLKKKAPTLIDDILTGKTTLAKEIDNPHIIDAGEKAVEATMNFQRGGRYIKTVNQFVPFFNVAFEGMKQPLRALVTGETGKKKAVLTLGGLSVANATMNIYNRIAYPEYADIPERIRASGAFIIMHEPTEFYPDGRPKPNYTVVLPRNMEWAFIMGGSSAAVESFYKSYVEELKKDGKISASDVATATAQAGLAWANTFPHVRHQTIPIDMFQGIPLPFASSIESLINGKDHYTNMPIIPIEKKDSPQSEQFRASTERFYKDVAKAGEYIPLISESPAVLEYIAESNFTYGAKVVTSVYDFIANMIDPEMLDEETQIHLDEYKSKETKEDKIAFQNTLNNDELYKLKLALNAKDPSSLGSPLTYKYHPDIGYGVYSELTEDAISELGANAKENENAEHELKAYNWSYRNKMRAIAELLEPDYYGVEGQANKTNPKDWVARRKKIKDAKASNERLVAEKYPQSIVGLAKKDEYFEKISIDPTSKLMNKYYSIKPETEDGREITAELGDDFTDKEWTTFYQKRDEFMESLSKEDRETVKKNIYARLEQGVEKEYKLHVESDAVKLYYGAFENRSIQTYLDNGEIDLNEVMPYLSKLSKKQQTSVINKVFGIDTETTSITGRVFRSTISPKVIDNKIQLADNPLLANRLKVTILAREWELNTNTKLTSTILSDEIKAGIINQNDQLLQQMVQLGADEETAMSYVNDIDKIERNNKFLMRAGNEDLANGLVKWVGNQHLKVDTVLTQTGISPNELASISGNTLANINKGVKASTVKLPFGGSIDVPAGSDQPKTIALHDSSYEIWNKYYNK